MSLLRRMPEAPVTSSLVVANLAVFAIMVATSGHLPLGAGFSGRTLVGAGASIGEPGWRWVTAAFVHVNVLHIVMNMWVLAQIGVLAERAIGRGLYLASYVLTGALGNATATLLASARGEPHVSAGASGAIMGLFGVAAVFAWRTGQQPIARALAKNVLFILAIGFAVTASGAIAVDNAAHIGGFVAGAIIGFARARQQRPLPRWADWLMAGVAVAVVAVAFLSVLARRILTA
jgi:rhomboid protease GluP